MVDFFFWFCAKDQSLVLPLVTSIKKWYRESGIVAVADGPVDMGLVSRLRSIGVKVLTGHRQMKYPGNCENYMLCGYNYLLLTSQASHFVQVDPDSVIRRDALIPDQDWAGQIFWDSFSEVISTVGAGAVFSRAAITALVDRLNAVTPAGSDAFLYKGGKVSDDAALGFYMSQMGLKPSPWVNEDGWLEVRLLPSYAPYLEDDRWAITHPAAPVRDKLIDPIMEVKGGVQMQLIQAVGQSFRPGARGRR